MATRTKTEMRYFMLSFAFIWLLTPLKSQQNLPLIRSMYWLVGQWQSESGASQAFTWTRHQNGSLEGVLSYSNSKMEERWLIAEKEGRLICFYTAPKSAIQSTYLGKKRAAGFFFQAQQNRQPSIIALEKDGLRKMKLIFSDLRPGTDREVVRRFIKTESRRWEFN
ncbi:MAG: hypothetical protein ACO3AF_00735 [Flavobacteriales bacterium]